MLELIKKKKKELNAIIIAHYYQLPEIQETADFVGTLCKWPGRQPVPMPG
jgi:quinolinate synthase